MPWIIAVILVLAIEAVAFLILPSAEQQSKTQTQSEKGPVADADVPIPWIFGEMTINATEVLAAVELQSRTYDV